MERQDHVDRYTIITLVLRIRLVGISGRLPKRGLKAGPRLGVYHYKIGRTSWRAAASGAQRSRLLVSNRINEKNIALM